MDRIIKLSRYMFVGIQAAFRIKGMCLSPIKDHTIGIFHLRRRCK